MKNKIIAHRGASNLAHENTLEAFQKAVDLNVGGIELDVRKTKDGRLICFHNPIIGKRQISRLTYAEVNILAKKKHYIVPTLEEALQLIAGKSQVHIEIKKRGYEKQVVETALKILTPEQFVIISFNFYSLKKIKKLYPEIKLGLILGANIKDLPKILITLVYQHKMLPHMDFLALNYKLVDCKLAKLFYKKIPWTLWTVNSSNSIARHLNNPQVIGITTNNPDNGMKFYLKEGLKAVAL